MKIKKAFFLVFLLVVMISVTGCIKFTSNDQAPVGSGLGVFATPDRGDTWLQRVKLMTPGLVDANIAGVEVTEIYMDPTDSDAIYLGTKGNGLYYSYGGGEGWTPASNLNRVAKGQVSAIAVDPKNKCNVYVAVNNVIYRSIDCNRTWERKFNTPKETQVISGLTIDYSNPAVIYAGATDGTIFKSNNFGNSYSNVANINKTIREIQVDLTQPAILYITTSNDGLYRSIDSGMTWTKLADGLKEYRGANAGYGLRLIKTNQTTLFYLSKYGLLKSSDQGNTWTPIKLLTEPDTTVFYAFDVSPKDHNMIFIADDKTLYRTVNGGESWETRKLPSTNRITDLRAHLVANAIAFIGFEKLPK